MATDSKINLQTARKQKLSAPEDEPMTSEIDKAQRLLAELHEKKKLQEEEEARSTRINERRLEFSELRLEVIQKLSEAIPVIEQDLVDEKNRIIELEKAKKHFQGNLKNIETIKPDRWDNDDVLTEADRYQNYLSKTVREYEQLVAFLKQGRGESSVKPKVVPLNSASSFGAEMLRGLAFTFPLIMAVTILFIIFSN